MKKIVALVYLYFISKELPAPFFRTIIVFSGLIIFHFFLLYAIFPIPKYLSPFGMNKLAINNYISGGVCFAILYIIIATIFNKKILERYSFSREQLKIGMRNLVVYFVILFFLIFLISLFNIRDRW